MTVRSYRELVCWQLSVELRDALIPILANVPGRRDVEFCRDLAASARSVSANIAEGFGRSPRTFRRHLDIAIGSLRETENHLDEALARRFLTPEEHDRFRRLAKRAGVAAGRLARYLESVAPNRRSRQPV